METGTSEIRNNSRQADAYYRARAAVLKNGADNRPTCTATRISANHLLTAMHCDGWVGQGVNFYGSAPNYAENLDAVVAHFRHQPGTDPDDCDTNTADGCHNTDGEFADIAVVRIEGNANGDLDAEGPVATLAWKYPGEVVGTKVGAGRHEGGPNDAGLLLQVDDWIVSSNDGEGYFQTEDDDTDDGDSGGPFYVHDSTLGAPVVVGVLWGWVDFGINDYNEYTSVPEHLPWILERIGFRWQGVRPRSSTKYSGGTVDTFLTKSELVCQYACEKTRACDAYNYEEPSSALDSGECQLKSNVTAVVSASSAWSSALKHGNRSGISNDVVGYARSDGWTSVVHRATNNRIHELYRGSQWQVGDIHSSAPAAASDVSAYVRSDGINAVVYRSSTNRIIELALVGGTWQWGDLSNAGGGTPAGNPVAYVRADGVSAVVYRGTNGSIYEIALGIGGWHARNLTSNAGSTIDASSDPAVVAREDGYSSVVFRSGTAIYELYRGATGDWSISSPSAHVENSTPAPAAGGKPFAYRHANGTLAIVYRSSGNKLIELWLDSAGWHWGQLSSTTIVGDPLAYLRNDTIESVLVRNTSLHVLEIANAPWDTFNLTAGLGMTAPAATNAAAFVRPDGYNSVVFETSDNRVREMVWKPGLAAWSWNDISVAAGETP